MGNATLDLNAIGSLIGGKRRRSGWQAFVTALHEAARPNGPLDGWAFHGATARAAMSIMREGLSPSHAVVNGPEAPDDWVTVEGTHWGTPAVAAFFAEDRIETYDDPRLSLAILAARIDDLAEHGDLVSDGQMLDCPLLSRLEVTEEALLADWEASDKGWRACWRNYGTIVVQGMGIPPGSMTMLRTEADVATLVARIAEDRAPTPAP